MQHLERSGTPVLYIGRKVLKGEISTQELQAFPTERLAA